MTINFVLQSIANYLVYNSWFLFLSALILGNGYLLWKIFQQQKKIIPKGRLIHFIYQSIATTDVQMGQVIQEIAEIKQQQDEILVQLHQWKDLQKQPSRQSSVIPKAFSKSNEMVYINAIKDLQSGKSLDEIALFINCLAMIRNSGGRLFT